MMLIYIAEGSKLTWQSIREARVSVLQLKCEEGLETHFPLNFKFPLSFGSIKIQLEHVF